jgi:hypothetical protein
LKIKSQEIIFNKIHVYFSADFIQVNPQEKVEKHEEKKHKYLS